MVSGRTRAISHGSLPWHREARWYVVGLESIVLTVIGGYILISTDHARNTILQLVGIVLLVTSVLLGAANLRSNEAALGFFDAFRAGIGVTVGAIATSSWWSSSITTHAIRIMLGWGLLAYGVIHLIGIVVVRGRAGPQFSVLASIALTLVLGIVLLTGNDTSSTGQLRVLGVILVVFGVVLGGLAYVLLSRGSLATAAPAITP